MYVPISQKRISAAGVSGCGDLQLQLWHMLPELELHRLLRQPLSVAVSHASNRLANDYLPNASELCSAWSAARSQRWYERASIDAWRHHQCSDARSPRVESAGGRQILQSRRTTGVAKALKYLAENAVHLASFSSPLRQSIQLQTPWLFAKGVRNGDATSCNESWGCFFASTSCGVVDAPSHEDEDRVLPAPIFPRPLSHNRSHLPTSLLTAMHMAFVLDRWTRALQPAAAVAVEQMLRTADESASRHAQPMSSSSERARTTSARRCERGVIGMAVRRSDACSERWRSCYSLSEYVAAARKLRSQYGDGFSTVHLMTDSDAVVRETRDYPEFTWRYLRLGVERDAVFSGGVDSHGEVASAAWSNGTSHARHARYPTVALLEERLAKTPPHGNETAALTLSLVAELRFLAPARLLVSQPSHVAQVAFLLSWARHGVLPPTIWLGVDPPLLAAVHARGHTLTRRPACCCSLASYAESEAHCGLD